MTEEQFEQLLSAVNGGFAALATAIEAIANSQNAVVNTRNLAGDSLTLRAPHLAGLEAQLEELDGDADVRRVHVASFTPQFKADAAQGGDINAAMGTDEGEFDSQSEAGLAYKVLARQVAGAAASSGGGGGAAPASDVPSCPKCGGETWDNRSKIAKYGGDGSWSDKAPPFKCKDRDGCDTPIGLDGKQFTFGGQGRGRGRAA